MTNIEGLRIIGKANYILFDEFGGVKDIRDYFNIILTDAFDAICAMMGSSSQPAQFDKLAIGTGTTGALVSDTALESLVAVSQGTYAHTDDTKVWTLEHTFSAGTPSFEAAITESGCYNGAGGAGTLLNRQTFSPLSKGTTDSLKITWVFTLA